MGTLISSGTDMGYFVLQRRDDPRRTQKTAWYWSEQYKSKHKGARKSWVHLHLWKKRKEKSLQSRFFEQPDGKID